MKATPIYFDYNSGAPLKSEARDAIDLALSQYGNASSVHRFGQAQKALLEQARGDIADFLGANREGIIFTASATEAAHLAFNASVVKEAKKIYCLASEHPCVLAAAGEKLQTIPVQENGLIDEMAFENIINSHNKENSQEYCCLALQLANSETGVVQPVAKIAKRVKAKFGENCVIICDAVQAIGRLPVDIRDLDVDMLLLSSHKIGGAQGAGALVLANENIEIAPIFAGGGQERNRRSSTENIAAIAGFGAAIRTLKQKPDVEKIEKLRNELENEIKASGLVVHIFGETSPRLANTLLFAIERVEAQTALIAFDLNGIAISSGSACAAGKVGESHVLQAMGIGKNLSQCALRVSIGEGTSIDEIKTFCNVFKTIIGKIVVDKEVEMC